MLRITTLDGHAGGRLLKLEGKLVAPWLDEVRRACAESAAAPGRLHLDLAAVTFVDAAGLRLLRELLHRDATLAACSGYVAAVLDREES
jgi:anti-anti-sigma regulatory factor